MEVAGAVLCGGRSRRMGADKALIEVGGTPMARRVADSLASAGVRPVAAVGGDSGSLTSLGLDVVTDEYPGEGPLGGIVTALRWIGVDADVLVVVACDLPRLDAATVSRLVEALARTPPSADVAVARTDRDEPLCAAWRVASTEPVLAAAFAGGARAVHVAWEPLTVVRVPVDSVLLANVNDRSDLAAFGDG